MRKAKPAAPVPRGPEASRLEAAIRALGKYGHVTVETRRGTLHVLADGEPVARLNPVGAGQYALSFHQHSGQWEPTPFAGDITSLADVLTTEFAPYLDTYDFPPIMRGPAH